MHKLIAIVGMAGAGKTTAAHVFENAGWKRIRFGDVTMEELQRRMLTVNEENEAIVRETLRVEQGMDAYAKLNEPKLIEALKHSNAVIDGLYSWQEYTYLKKKLPNIILLAIYASPKTRHNRLSTRKERPLTDEEAAERDNAELENIRKAEPIAIADFTIVNENTKEVLAARIHELIMHLEGKHHA